MGGKLIQREIALLLSYLVCFVQDSVFLIKSLLFVDGKNEYILCKRH